MMRNKEQLKVLLHAHVWGSIRKTSISIYFFFISGLTRLKEEQLPFYPFRFYPEFYSIVPYQGVLSCSLVKKGETENKTSHSASAKIYDLAK